jgi:hypothetical protein
MSDPVLRVRLPVQRGALYVYILMLLVKIDSANRRSFSRERIRHAERLEERGGDEIHVLAWVGEQAHHAQQHKGRHGARVVVAWEPGVRGVEARWDVWVFRALDIATRPKGRDGMG